MQWIFVFLGGGVGSLLRFGMSKIVDAFYKSNFPLATLLSNIAACIILALTLLFIKDKINDNEFIKYFVVIGLCGGFSTFSAFGLDTFKLIQSQELLIATLNIVISLLFGVGIFILLLR